MKDERNTREIIFARLGGVVRVLDIVPDRPAPGEAVWTQTVETYEDGQLRPGQLDADEQAAWDATMNEEER